MTGHRIGRGAQVSIVQLITAASLAWEQATTVTAVLTASLTAFQLIREIARSCEDREPHLFAAFFSATAAATEGCEWLIPAVSSPPGSPAAGIAAPPGTGTERLGDSLAVLAAALASRLAMVAGLATAPGHEAACRKAAAAARTVHDLLTGPGHATGPR